MQKMGLGYSKPLEVLLNLKRKKKKEKRWGGLLIRVLCLLSVFVTRDAAAAAISI